MFSLFFIAGIAILIGIGLAILVTRRPPPGEALMVPPEEDYARDPKDVPDLTVEQLEKLAEALCRENQLTVKERVEGSADETYWVAESRNEFFFGNYVLAFHRVSHAHPFVTMKDVLEFKDFTKSVSGTKGFYFTTGYFTADVHQPLEGVKVTLFNRLKVLSELKARKLA